MHDTFSVFFSGTTHKANQTNTLVYLLNKHIDINDLSQKAMSFDGCAVTNGSNGLIFGAGLSEQCDEVYKKVLEAISKGHSVVLNVYGHSRGAIAGLLLAQKLQKIKTKSLTVNLALLDPVPGNFILTQKLDSFRNCLANQTMDVQACSYLKKVLTLYPHEPLPDIALHAPLFSNYPKESLVEEDVIAGFHSGTQFQKYSENGISFCADSFVSFARIFQFLKQCGSKFTSFPKLTVKELPELKIDLNELDKALEVVYDFQNSKEYKGTRRHCHSKDPTYIITKEKGSFLNLHHQSLKEEKSNSSDVRMHIEKKGMMLANANSRFNFLHPSNLSAKNKTPTQSGLKNINMQILNGFIIALGALAVATAFIFLNAALLNPVGLTVAILGAVATFTGIFLFAHNRNNNKPKSDLEQNAPIYSPIL